MSDRGQALAERFEKVNGDVMAFVEGCDDVAWQTMVPEEERTVGVVAHHVASAYSAVNGWITSLAADQPVEITMEQIHQLNERHKARFAHPERTQVTELLRRDGAALAQTVRELDDQELDAKAHFGPANRPLRAAQVAEYVLISHPTDHLANMRKALGR
jgi:hypothetical protein